MHYRGCNWLRALLSAELRRLVTIKPSDRPWQTPCAAAFATGLPLLTGAYFDRMDYGQISSLGGLIFLYLPETPLFHRMVSLMVYAFAMIACYALGLLSHLLPSIMMAVLTFTAILVTMACRFYRIEIPGNLFFIMAAAIAAYSPVDFQQIPINVGLVAMGCLFACLIAFFYSILILQWRTAKPVEPLPALNFDFVVLDSAVIGLCVGISLAVAQLLQLDNAYWVPVSCLAVIQGASLRGVWDKQVHRLVGTGIGLLLSWGLLALSHDKWSICATIMALTFVVETAVVRHYGFAVIFITPLTILLADATTMGNVSAAILIHARFIDTLLGCLVGLLGGIFLHNQRFRIIIGGLLRRLIFGRLSM